MHREKKKIESFWPKKLGQILVPPVTQPSGSNFSFASDSTLRVKTTPFYLSVHWEKIESFWPKKLGQILVPPVTQLLRSKLLNTFSWCTERKIELFWPKKLSSLSWVEIKIFKLQKPLIVSVTQRVTGSLVLLLKLLINKIYQNYCYMNYILKWFWKWF